MLKRIALALGAMLLACTAQAADNNYPTPGGATVPLAVSGCLNGSNQAVACSSATPLNVTGTITTTAGNAVGATPTDRTITSASGASQQVMAANASRHSLTIVNTGNANCGVNPTGGTAAIGGAGTLTLVPNGSYTPRVPTLSAVTIICTAAQPIYADEN